MKKELSELRVAIVCDWLTGIGGAERVVLELHNLFPDAPIYTSQYSPEKIDWFKDADVRTTWLQKLPKSLKKFYPVLRAISFSRLDLSDYDLVLSSSGAEAKGVKIGKNTIHINYCHSPTHYYWVRHDEYLDTPGFGAFDWLARLGLKILVGPMRKWDYKAAQKPTFLIANSTFTQANIMKYYGRESVVIHPPVDTNRFKLNNNSVRKGFVVAGRQTPYKKIDLVVSVCTRLGIDLTVIGNGPDHNKLIAMAGPTISFVTNAKDSDMPTLYQKAEALFLPNVDDFGIVAVEAMSTGTPVIGYAVGGTRDYIEEAKTGIFFDEQSEESITDAIRKFRSTKFSPTEIAAESNKFSVVKFRENITAFIKQVI